MTDPTKPDEPQPVVLPLAPPAAEPPPTEPVQQGMKVWYVLRGSTILGVVLFALGFVGVIVYMTTDREHLHETVFLFVMVGLIAWGAHLMSRQSVKNFLADVGSYLPWSKKSDGGDG